MLQHMLRAVTGSLIALLISNFDSLLGYDIARPLSPTPVAAVIGVHRWHPRLFHLGRFFDHLSFLLFLQHFLIVRRECSRSPRMQVWRRLKLI